MADKDAVPMDRYFSGELLFGDDFTPEQIARWHADEKEGYADLGAGQRQTYVYHYHALNRFHGFSRLPDRPFERILGFGSAYGDELMPVLEGAREVTIVDPSSAFVQESVQGVPARYIQPSADGRLPLDDAQFDLICCFGVLHHIPNVSAVLAELARVLKPGGYLLLREPIVSMGDWRTPRPGLTKRERGIPVPLLERAATAPGLVMQRRALCDFSLTSRLFGRFVDAVYNSATVVRLDALLARLFAWNVHYHARSMLQRVRPASVFLVLSKPRGAAGARTISR